MLDIINIQGDAIAITAQAFPHAITQDKAGIEDRDLRLVPREQVPIDGNQDRRITWIIHVFVGALAHGKSSKVVRVQLTAVLITGGLEEPAKDDDGTHRTDAFRDDEARQIGGADAGERIGEGARDGDGRVGKRG